MMTWLEALRTRPAAAGDAYLVTVLSARASAPREPGAKMLVDREGIAGTIGGGRLEYESARIACDALAGGAAAFARRFVRGANLGQCCGGIVEVLFERVAAGAPWLQDLISCDSRREAAVVASGVDPEGRPVKMLVTADDSRVYGAGSIPTADVVDRARGLLAGGGARPVRVRSAGGGTCVVLLEHFGAPAMSLALFGAGHVGSAVVAALAGLDCEIRWVDTRRRVFPAAAPGNVVMIETADPVREVAAMPPGAYYLVMTHSHPLDYRLCEAILRRGDFAYAGLIGSRAKRRRFEQRMRKAALPAAWLERLTCPIGIDGIGGKRPAEIAISVAAQLLEVCEAQRSRSTGPASPGVRVLRP